MCACAALLSAPARGDFSLDAGQSIYKDKFISEREDEARLALDAKLAAQAAPPPGPNYNVYTCVAAVRAAPPRDGGPDGVCARRWEAPYVDNTGRFEYTIQLTVDPCKGYNYTCCDDVFGSPEYRTNDANADAIIYTAQGDVLDTASSRLADPALVVRALSRALSRYARTHTHRCRRACSRTRRVLWGPTGTRSVSQLAATTLRTRRWCSQARRRRNLQASALRWGTRAYRIP